MQAGLLGHEEQPPELTLRNLHRERRKRGKRWSQVFQLSNVSFETGGLNVGGMIDQRNPPHPLIRGFHSIQREVFVAGMDRVSADRKVGCSTIDLCILLK